MYSNTISMDLCQHSQTLHVRCDTDMFVRLASLPLLASDWLELTQRSSEHTKTWCLFLQEWNPCDALIGHNESFSAYPLMTLPMWSAVIRMSFTSITDTLQEEFANKG